MWLHTWALWRLISSSHWLQFCYSPFQFCSSYLLGRYRFREKKFQTKLQNLCVASYGEEVGGGLPYKNFIFFIQLPHNTSLLWLALVIFTLHCQTDGRNQNIIHFTYLTVNIQTFKSFIRSSFFLFSLMENFFWLLRVLLSPWLGTNHCNSVLSRLNFNSFSISCLIEVNGALKWHQVSDGSLKGGMRIEKFILEIVAKCR